MVKKPTVSISKLTFSGGQSFEFSPNEKVILVGPNNSGKSLSLREISELATRGTDANRLVIKQIKFDKSGTVEDLRAFLVANAEYSNNHYLYKDWPVHSNHINYWDQPYLLHGLARGFIKNIEANDRLSICDQQKSISPSDQKSRPQHLLYDDTGLLNKVNALFRQAFSQDIFIDYRGGSKIPFHVGSKPKFRRKVDSIDNKYVEAVRKNPLLDKQGDGIKSYTGLLFEAVVSDRDITLIDEPEAFLHPPQMRRLGETLSSEVRGQLIIATHSSDILRGFLEGTQGEVRILRIRREADKNVVTEATPNTIKELWEKPVLRYSNALEGIFHEQTILCEDDSDCRIINSVGDYIASTHDDPWRDTAYVPTGGKHQIPKVANILRQIGVPVKAIFDIDFLSEESLVKEAVNAFDGDWDEVNKYWKKVDAAVRKGIKPITIPEIKDMIRILLGEAGEDELPKSDIIEAIKQDKPWNQIKKFGEDGIPKGKAQQDFKNLRDILEDIGIYLVPVGEIENFCRDIGLKGPKFVTKLLSEKSLDDADLDKLRTFVEKVHTG